MTRLETGPKGERQKFTEMEINQHFGEILATLIFMHVITSFRAKHIDDFVISYATHIADFIIISYAT